MENSKEYAFSLTDEEVAHLVIAIDGWHGEQKKSALHYMKPLFKSTGLPDKAEHRKCVASELLSKLYTVVKSTNPQFNIGEMWDEVMFDV